MSNKPGNERFIDEVTAIMREADPLFEKTGGSTRHYVRDLLLPMMEEKGLIITKSPSPQLDAGEGRGKVLRWVKAEEVDLLNSLHRIPIKTIHNGEIIYSLGTYVHEDQQWWDVHLNACITNIGLYFLQETDAPADQHTLAKEKVIALIELYKSQIPEEKYGWEEHVGDLDNIIFDIENNLQPTDAPAPVAAAPLQEAREMASEAGMSQRDFDRQQKPVAGEVDNVVGWFEFDYEKETEIYTENKNFGKATQPMQDIRRERDETLRQLEDCQEKLKEITNDRDVYKEWYERSQASIASLTSQLEGMQKERDVFRDVLQGIDNDNGPGEHILTKPVMEYLLETLKKYPKQ